MAEPRQFPGLPKKLKDLRKHFEQLCRNDVPGVLAARTYAQTFLDALRQALAVANGAADQWALLAVGGFGRGEMSFLSDLDLLFLYQRRLPPKLEQVVHDLVYGLWDADFEVGHATASVSSVSDLIRDDFSAETTYLSPRFIAGDQSFYQSWREKLLKAYGPQRRRRFLQRLLDYRTARLGRYGESSYLLEPQVKEGIGGLRDLHLIHWLGMVFLQAGELAALRREGWLDQDEQDWLEGAHDFLWRVRLQLHQSSGRRQDQLLLGEQEQMARRCAFVDGREGSAVEAFMRFYYRHTARIRRVTSFLLERLEQSQVSAVTRRLRRRRILEGPLLMENNRLQFLEPELISGRPGTLMLFFWQAAKTGAHFHHQAGRIIRANLPHFDAGWREHPEVIRQFFDLLQDSRHGFRVLKAMMETGFLQVFIPEFAAVRYRVQHDVYHLYTVDEHLLRTVGELHRMRLGQDDEPIRLDFPEVFAQLEHPRVLFLAALIHDLGKGQGKDHSARGAVMAREIGARLRLDPEEAELLEYLVANHLLLAETALKRDLGDEKPVLRCALAIADRERLRLLYLLTVADSRATGPGAWNTWRASLLRELFLKVDHILVRGDWRAPDLEQHTREVQARVLAMVQGDPRQAAVERWLDGLSVRYLLAQGPQAILDHYQMELGLRDRTLVVSAEPAAGDLWQVTLAARDRPGLFACIAGVLWTQGLNILAAELFTRSSGIALDVITVEQLPDPLHPEQLWQRVQTDLEAVLSDRAHLETLIEREQRSSFRPRKPGMRKPDRVVIDEDASDFYTVVEVYTWDRPGILFAVSNAFFELSLSIQVAKISTPGAQVVDVFYLTDLDGNKLLDAEKHERVRARLLECLAAC